MPRRPPKAWFDKMKRKVRKAYPDYPEKRINKIVAGIWWAYRPSTRRRIVKKKEVKKTGRKRRKRKGGKKWGKIGSPHSAKRKRHLARIRKRR